MDIDDKTRTELEAAAFRKLVQHLRDRTEVQNIDLMNLAGFCRNCLANWYQEAAKAGGEMFFRVLAEERPDLTVASINPGRMDTDMQGVLRRSEFPTKQSYVDAHRDGTLGRPHDVAARIISEHVTRA